MIKNFEIGKGGYSNELHMGGVRYDLHNQYSFEGMFLDAFKRLEIRFKPDDEYGKGLNSLTLIFENIIYLEFSPTFGSKEILGIDEMGYKEEGDNDDEWLISPEYVKENMHFFLRLIPNDVFIRVLSEKALLLETNPKLTSI